MSEFVWKNRYKIITDEITRGSQISIWNEVRNRGLLSHTLDGEAISVEDMEDIAEVVAVYATTAVYECEKNRWKTANKVLDIVLPITPDGFNQLPISLANGWIEAAVKDNTLLSFINFPSASGISIPAGDEAPPDNTP
jgi:hypothetical protein